MDYVLPTKDPEQLYLHQGSCAFPPVDVEGLARAMGIVFDNNFSLSRFGYSGEIRWQENRPVVWINPGDSLVRKRFTLAHEIGHYILHMLDDRDAVFKDDVKIMRRGGEWTSKEMQANRFAASLLMPKALLVAEMQKPRFWGPTTAHLAERFQVSEESMGYRLSNLGLKAS
ncbi:ImmA/IrrE family metallo-endopeptidase [Luteolibacter ambystomatis]|uniref:ImmA/IrrE family metallo-endopeptidase n=1 Tax=Luteolibacter ambystomatis TaxID=2824561 RepID=A0A975IZN9_9BACT|nr:ImmA/IrrE family metallo-endopeptidase [Luteolibacter ambystomatis]QUE51148.1 ImmA/IrrE family metallo-endopeptidase [Luteolibacter ambystomatis]